jgi:hypothetical protein
MGLNAHKLRVLGNFAITYLLLHPEVLFKPRIEEISWEEVAKEVISKFYEIGGMQRPSEWLDYPLKAEDDDREDYEADAINNTASAVRTFLLNHFNETYNKYVRNLIGKATDSYGRPIDPEYTNLSLTGRIDFCIDHNLTPYVKNNGKGKIIITHDILEALQKQGGIDSDMISSLNRLAIIVDMQYGNVMQNNKQVNAFMTKIALDYTIL